MFQINYALICGHGDFRYNHCYVVWFQNKDGLAELEEAYEKATSIMKRLLYTQKGSDTKPRPGIISVINTHNQPQYRENENALVINIKPVAIPVIPPVLLPTGYSFSTAAAAAMAAILSLFFFFSSISLNLSAMYWSTSGPEKSSGKLGYVQLGGGGAPHVEPPVASQRHLAEDGAIGAQEGRLTPVEVALAGTHLARRVRVSEEPLVPLGLAGEAGLGDDGVGGVVHPGLSRGTALAAGVWEVVHLSLEAVEHLRQERSGWSVVVRLELVSLPLWRLHRRRDDLVVDCRSLGAVLVTRQVVDVPRQHRQIGVYAAVGKGSEVPLTVGDENRVASSTGSRAKKWDVGVLSPTAPLMVTEGLGVIPPCWGGLSFRGQLVGPAQEVHDLSEGLLAAHVRALG
uniref:Uncharacterized protein n=1 Tax=Timema douglasi TaxID=61478 RepID=A0A7R8VQT8_TIMDO|nr:unnamed protein product [Timema douglasi]